MSMRDEIDRLESETLDELVGRSLLATADWSDSEILAGLDLAELFQSLDRAGLRTPLFPSQLFYALFFDQSTRTKSSWAGAAARLGAHPVIVDGASTQVSHGETAEETGAMLGMNAHALGIRHDLLLGEGHRFMRDAVRGITDYLRATGDSRSVPVVNLQCDVDHPTQTLADLAWLGERFPDGVRGKTIAVSWAYSPSYAKPLSVPQGLIMLLSRFGMNVRLARPPGYDLGEECIETARRNAAASGGRFDVLDCMDDAFDGADVVYPKSWGPHDLMRERVEAHRANDGERMRDVERRALKRNRAHADWIADRRRMGLTRNRSALYMHCLPADVGAEVSPEVFRAARKDVARQAGKKAYVIMAALAATKEADVRGRLQACL